MKIRYKIFNDFMIRIIKQFLDVKQTDDNNYRCIMKFMSVFVEYIILRKSFI